ncbi:hypothetical protein TRIATDRAFT_301987 [Trichoderma atroviride IMI 206040]|uniref:Uncharacterized protein n=1 Tax=Hypocrea atroviridis (strain ATCC 20476 / IMI 206040) TaxID=452589 RepID=G9P678_HYPAI|nr:uncharacterized protein TRIATDRAFT_301987 [Trichoderma atroviride IMI 206040]EHK41410.1 hypothetical protein TRIATDRAFT_301987 [Trichoderma atroviride IMI 206040]
MPEQKQQHLLKSANNSPQPVISPFSPKRKTFVLELSQQQKKGREASRINVLHDRSAGKRPRFSPAAYRVSISAYFVFCFHVGRQCKR